MVDIEVKRLVKDLAGGQSRGALWNLIYVLVGGIIFGAGMEIGKMAIRHAAKEGLKMQLDY